MPWFRVAFLLLVLAGTSGYRFRCYIFCKDQTAIQNDYIEQRDRCREYAELKLDMALRDTRGPVDGKKQKTKLVSLFNSCMADNGWNIAPELPPYDSAAPVEKPPTAEAKPLAPPPEVVEAHESKAALSRSADCMFARHAANHSSIAAARAQACDLECSQRLRAAPDAPRPAACPTDVTPDVNLITGGEKTF
ncbi:MAG: hypothetical protein ACN2B6_01775 [Rickettsiales bacterium]